MYGTFVASSATGRQRDTRCNWRSTSKRTYAVKRAIAHCTATNSLSFFGKQVGRKSKFSKLFSVSKTPRRKCYALSPARQTRLSPTRTPILPRCFLLPARVSQSRTLQPDATVPNPLRSSPCIPLHAICSGTLLDTILPHVHHRPHARTCPALPPCRHASLLARPPCSHALALTLAGTPPLCPRTQTTLSHASTPTISASTCTNANAPSAARASFPSPFCAGSHAAVGLAARGTPTISNAKPSVGVGCGCPTVRKKKKKEKKKRPKVGTGNCQECTS